VMHWQRLHGGRGAELGWALEGVILVLPPGLLRTEMSGLVCHVLKEPGCLDACTRCCG
jgi:hypothetical protein